MRAPALRFTITNHAEHTPLPSSFITRKIGPRASAKNVISILQCDDHLSLSRTVGSTEVVGLARGMDAPRLRSIPFPAQRIIEREHHMHLSRPRVGWVAAVLLGVS